MWVLWAVMSAVCWGVWGYFSGSAAKHGTQWGVLAGAVLIEAALVLPAAGKVRQSLSWPLVGVAVFGVIAYGAFFLALRTRGHLAAVVTISALYPAVTYGIALLLGTEALASRKVVGIALAAAAVALLAT